MKELAKIKLPEEISNSIEYSYFLKEADKEILDNIITKKSGYDYDKETFDYFYKKYTKHRTEFELKIRETAKAYSGNKFLTNENKIEVNFIEGIMYIYEEEANRRISGSNC